MRWHREGRTSPALDLPLDDEEWSRDEEHEHDRDVDEEHCSPPEVVQEYAAKDGTGNSTPVKAIVHAPTAVRR